MEAINEDKEEYLEKTNVNNQEIIKIKPRFIFKAKRIPTYVATPLPPLNLSQIGNTCPKKIQRETI